MGIHIMPPIYQIVIAKKRATITFTGTGMTYALLLIDPDYSTCHDAATGTIWSGLICCGQLRQSDYQYQIHRQPLSWDTSSLGIGASPVSGYLTLIRGAYYQRTYHDDFVIVPGNNIQMGEDPDDYGRLLSQTTNCGSINSADLPGSGETFTIALNSSGLAQISKVGTTKLGLRMGRDISTTNPGNARDGVRCYFVSNPSLTITYDYHD